MCTDIASMLMILHWLNGFEEFIEKETIHLYHYCNSQIVGVK